MKSQAKQDTSNPNPKGWNKEKQEKYDKLINKWKGEKLDKKTRLRLEIKSLKNQLIKLIHEYLKYE